MNPKEREPSDAEAIGKVMDNGASSYRRFLDGDLSAFDNIIDLYRDSLIFFINRYVNDFYTAEEIAAESFAVLLLEPNRYNFSVSLKTYLFTIGKNRAIDFLRKRNRRGSLSLEDIPEVEASEASFVDEILKDEEKRKLHEAIGRLKEDYRVAVHLVYFDDMTVAEAARVMGKSPKQVENLLYRARNALRNELGDMRY